MVYLPYPLLSSRSQNIEFNIDSGQSLNLIADNLAIHGLINSRYVFEAYVRLSGDSKRLQAGKYLINQPVSISQLVNDFSNGLAESNDIEITIPEGTNIADIDKLFAGAGLMQEGDFLKPQTTRLDFEGYLFPDTYRFDRKISLLDPQARINTIFQVLNSNFKAKTAKLLAGLTQAQNLRFVIIASILEREVKTQSDMQLVTGIIERRLKLGMPLEIDATVAYGVCYPKWLSGKYCNVSSADIVDNIVINTAYNTYVRKGLPQGPISNPGLRSIEAALQPAPSDYLYYLTTKDGVTIFSKTAAEHLIARQKYLK